MKRSEMVILLTKIISNNTSYNCTDYEADHILHEIEHTGMLPPSSIVKLIGSYDNNAVTHVIKNKVTGEYEGACTINRWEPEDE